MRFNFTVRNKVIKPDDDTYRFISDNTDYTAHFDFDSEWDGLIKTVRFISGGTYTDVLLPPDGTVAVPREAVRPSVVSIGVFAGELHTTTPCQLRCDLSILSSDGVPSAPTEDVYSQIITLCGQTRQECDETLGAVSRLCDALGGKVLTVPANTGAVRFGVASVEDRGVFALTNPSGVGIYSIDRENLCFETLYEYLSPSSRQYRDFFLTPTTNALCSEIFLYNTSSAPSDCTLTVLFGRLSVYEQPTPSAELYGNLIKPTYYRPLKQTTSASYLLLDDFRRYHISGTASLSVDFPAGDFECWISLLTPSEGVITVTFPSGTKYIGEMPVFSNGEAWEISIKNGVVAAQRVGDNT